MGGKCRRISCCYSIQEVPEPPEELYSGRARWAVLWSVGWREVSLDSISERYNKRVASGSYGWSDLTFHSMDSISMECG